MAYCPRDNELVILVFRTTKPLFVQAGSGSIRLSLVSVPEKESDADVIAAVSERTAAAADYRKNADLLFPPALTVS